MTTATAPATFELTHAHLTTALDAAGIDHWTEAPGTVLVPLSGARTATVAYTGCTFDPYRVTVFDGPPTERAVPATVFTGTTTTVVGWLSRNIAPASPASPVTAAMAAYDQDPSPATLAALRAAETASRARYLSAAPTRQGRAHQAAHAPVTPRERVPMVLTRRGEYALAATGVLALGVGAGLLRMLAGH